MISFQRDMLQSEEERKAKRHEYCKKRYQNPEIKAKILERNRERRKTPEAQQKKREYDRQYRQKSDYSQKRLVQLCRYKTKRLIKNIPIRAIELEKLKANPNISKVECCKRLCCSITRQLAQEKLASLLSPEEIAEVIEVIKYLEKTIFQKTHMTPQCTPNMILIYSLYIWNVYVGKPYREKEISEKSDIGFYIRLQFIKWLIRIQIIQIDDYYYGYYRKYYRVFDPDLHAKLVQRREKNIL